MSGWVAGSVFVGILLYHFVAGLIRHWRRGRNLDKFAESLSSGIAHDGVSVSKLTYDARKGYTVYLELSNSDGFRAETPSTRTLPDEEAVEVFVDGFVGGTWANRVLDTYGHNK